MIYSYKKILEDIKNNTFFNIYFLMGEESYFIDKITNYFIQNFIKEEHKSFDQEIIYGKDSDINTIINRCKRFPMMSEKQLIVIKESQNLSFFKNNKENEYENFNNYLSNPAKQTFLLFAFKNKVLDQRKKITKKIIESCVVLNTEDKQNKVYENQLPEWIKGEVKENKFSIEEKAIILLIENIGNNLNKIENELQKVYLNKKDNQIINSKDIEMFVGINRDYNLFELQDSLINKDLKKAIKIISYFESNPKNNPMQKTILFLFNFFSKLLFVMSYKPKETKNISQILKIHPFAAKSYMKATNKYSMSDVKKIIKYFKEIDLISKGIKLNNNKEGILLKELIYKMTYV